MNNLLTQADLLTNGARQQDWGDPTLTHQRIAQAWSAILNHPVTSHQAGLCMVALKLIRSSINPTNKDSLLDAAGYCKLAWGCVEDTKIS